MKKTIQLLVFLVVYTMLPNRMFSQNQPYFDQYHFNQFIINPACAGSKGNISSNIFLHRQWTGMEGAPETQSISVNAPFANKKIGLGAKMIHDQIGITNVYQFGLDYAYRMYTYKGILSIGLEANVMNYRLNYSKLDAYNNGDPVFINQDLQFWAPNAGFGVWFNNDHFFAGISAPILVEQSEKESSIAADLNLYEEKRHYYLSAGYLIKASDNFSIKPYTLIKYLPNTAVQIDANLSFIFRNNFWIGGSYRTNKSVTVMAEYFVNSIKTLQTNQIGFGYSYNFFLDDYQTYFGPSHELFISYDLYKNTTQIANPRLF